MRPFMSLMGADPSQDCLHAFETSWLFSPFVLGCIRALISLYSFTTIFVIFGWQGTHGLTVNSRRSFSYFTNLSYWGIAFYFLFAAAHSFLYSRTGRSVFFEKTPRFLRALHSLFYTTIVVFPFIVTIVYWGLLFEAPWFPEMFNGWSNVSQHAMQSGFALFELIFTATQPLPLIHLPFLYLLLMLYLSLAYLTRATQGFYTYSFLNPGVHSEHRGRVAAYSFGIAAAATVLFGVCWFIIWLRRRLTGDKRILATPSRGTEDEEMRVRK
ncbi:uncharacterized protein GIQ15_03304 [Arthroderma uncinatum]|uniref:uncharacterized protein n=1 Tax=Arthroderma uncinatum TaxID=74035 RepID=UPI00144A9AD0|nr:uncharacterized protein GIQ15_03304 [Arthroderma uncinatum]KAF3483980.1 hypothetical protein GIQ15_03304 [Arthroderma uncinatum]